MASEELTVVIPTRDRPRLLELCLRSVFERQKVPPPVIVSDNSTVDQPVIEALRKKYGFTYVRRSGRLPIVEHQNGCLQIPTSRWVLLLHDDDELYPGAVAKLREFLLECGEAGIVMAGTQTIDGEGQVLRQWVPRLRGVFKGEEGLLALGLDWGERAPGTVYGTQENQQIGGLPVVDGLPGDYAHSLFLAYRHGVAFLPELVGRYRTGHEQTTQFATPQKAEAWLVFSCRQAALLRDLGCSRAAADRIMDYLAWSTFEALEPQWTRFDRRTVTRLVDVCLRYSPEQGERQAQVRWKYRSLFWRPRWAINLLTRRVDTIEGILRLLRRLAGRA